MLLDTCEHTPISFIPVSMLSIISFIPVSMLSITSFISVGRHVVLFFSFGGSSSGNLSLEAIWEWVSP